MESPHCYCSEREKSPESDSQIPPGFCGICEICQRPGHTRAHPHLPVTSAWCEQHWEEVLHHRPLPLIAILGFMGLVLIGFWLAKYLT